MSATPAPPALLRSSSLAATPAASPAAASPAAPEAAQPAEAPQAPAASAAPAPEPKTKSDPEGARAAQKRDASAVSSSAASAKKQKTEVIPTVGVAVAAIALPDLQGDEEKIARVLVGEGDRHNWTPELEQEWNEQFYGESPHSVYRVPYGEERLELPAKFFASCDGNVSLREVAPDDCAKAIVMHMIIKKQWVPKAVVSQEDCEAIMKLEKKSPELEAMAKDVVNKSTEEQRANLYRVLKDFSRTIDEQNLSAQEIACGGIEKGETSVEAAMRELGEEMGLSIPKNNLFAMGYVIFQDRKGNKKRTDLFSTVCYNAPESIEDEFQLRQKIVGNWFCAHSWFNYLPNFNSKAMEKIKALCETRNVRALTHSEAKKILDEKSLNALNVMGDHLVVQLAEFNGRASSAGAFVRELSRFYGGIAKAMPYCEFYGLLNKVSEAEPKIIQDQLPPGAENLKPYKLTNNKAELQSLLDKAKSDGDQGAIDAYTGMLKAL